MFDADIQKPSAPNQRCPLGVDLRVLLKKRLSGDFIGAYKYYQSKVVFPEVISRTCSKPCLSHNCQTANKNQRLITDIEKACANVKLQTSPETIVPHNWKTAAVIGGGIGGAACAILLRNRGYDVDLYEKTDALGGKLKTQMPSEVLQKELFIPMSSLNVVVLYHTHIQDTAICNDYDVVCNTAVWEWRQEKQENLFHFFESSTESTIASVIAGMKAVDKYLDDADALQISGSFCYNP